MKQGVHNHVKEQRKHRGFTQDQLAEKIGVTRQTIIAIEKQRYEPLIGTAIKLAAVLKCPVEKLFWIEGDN
ncbi:helix-turn-helix transcriptional regulator [Domibacillus sp. DTU_2020_1001157_1_SI_ALB_TIR_016]|uniref:helix-turn-helix transcriptional regulator n=1 Tax=Domibacillus sp. DTU_2020_1001157_1_SI_ALB_TIR_016 TaxID=3077789 RepID=UPI0028E20F20|nr:helix-turn-helix transcriptional regulator [Domibacillus sp. DTU_2020_1001157_1_SI_ALB_TIR_016]WNS78215.1 helix-turn-helix transcriptional regulator [Domibacillus sp. DTU_2020_1001157_1_SI_ALB_TIR_016]